MWLLQRNASVGPETYAHSKAMKPSEASLTMQEILLALRDKEVDHKDGVIVMKVCECTEFTCMLIMSFIMERVS